MIDIVVGARPNFMKVAPVIRAAGGGTDPLIRLVHTGQHYDAQMSDAFFTDLGLPAPQVSLGVGSGSHAEQVAKIMVAYETVVLDDRPAVCMVVGDVNSTVAAALVAAKLHIPVAHLEAGLRSRDMSMPEEVNRLATDAISTMLLTPSRDADENLRNEGVAESKIRFVGNLMIDTLHYQLERARALPFADELGLGGKPFVLVTLHRPSNVDHPVMLGKLVALLGEIGRGVPVLFPIHPRTRQRIESAGLANAFTRFIERAEPVAAGLIGLPPLSYNEFLHLLDRTTVVLTDSGGVQEETTVLGKPCLTLRENTERPITVTEGTNMVVGADLELARRLVAEALAGRGKQGGIPEGWDGHAGERVVSALRDLVTTRGTIG